MAMFACSSLDLPGVSPLPRDPHGKRKNRHRWKQVKFLFPRETAREIGSSAVQPNPVLPCTYQRLKETQNHRSAPCGEIEGPDVSDSTADMGLVARRGEVHALQFFRSSPLKGGGLVMASPSPNWTDWK